MIELVHKDEVIRKIRNNKEKVLFVIPFIHTKDKRKLNKWKKKIKVLYANGIVLNYDFVNSNKYKEYDYYLIISYTDIYDKIYHIEKVINKLFSN